MRIFTLLFLSFFVLLSASTDAQDRRYLEPIFDDVVVSQPTPVASNYTILQWLFAALNGQAGNTIRQPLVAQFYSPAGDTVTNRPLVIYLHTGNFFPFPQNGSCSGTLRDSSNVEIATRLAKMGYVVAVVNYRQGWNPFDQNELVRRYFLINAAYRGVQDVNTYVRYFKHSVAQLQNPHGIDPNKITVWGQGTGGYLSLAAAYLNQYSEILTTSDPTKFILPTPAGPIPMVIEQYNGNLNATGPLTTVDAVYNQLSQLPIGDTLCVPNYVDYDSDFALAVNMGGALGDSTWVSAGEVPLISFHVPSDAFAPCETDVLNVPTPLGPQPVVEVSGSCDVQAIVNRLGLNEVFSTIPEPAINDPYGAGDASNGLYLFDNTPEDSSSPWEWSASATTTGGATGCNTDAASAKTYIDTIVGYFAPRACVALGLDCAFIVSTKDLTDLDVNLMIAPNPSNTDINVTSDANQPVQAYALFDISGRMIRNVAQMNDNAFTIKRQGLDNGIYILMLQFEKGRISKKIVIR